MFKQVTETDETKDYVLSKIDCDWTTSAMELYTSHLYAVHNVDIEKIDGYSGGSRCSGGLTSIGGGGAANIRIKPSTELPPHKMSSHPSKEEVSLKKGQWKYWCWQQNIMSNQKDAFFGEENWHGVRNCVRGMMSEEQWDLVVLQTGFTEIAKDTSAAEWDKMLDNLVDELSIINGTSNLFGYHQKPNTPFSALITEISKLIGKMCPVENSLKCKKCGTENDIRLEQYLLGLAVFSGGLKTKNGENKLYAAITGKICKLYNENKVHANLTKEKVIQIVMEQERKYSANKETTDPLLAHQVTIPPKPTRNTPNECNVCGKAECMKKRKNGEYFHEQSKKAETRKTCNWYFDSYTCWSNRSTCSRKSLELFNH